MISEYITHGDPAYMALQPSFTILHPSTTQLISVIDSVQELEYILDPLKIQQKEWIFMPVNDQESDEAGGTHWSLLVFSKRKNSSTLYDSGSLHPSVGKSSKIAKHLMSYLKYGNENVSHLYIYMSE